MLTLLRVRQLAIIDELELEFSRGLNVITGETGAGKSILILAMQLVLGARGKVSWVRSGAEAAEVEAMFELDRPAEFAPILEELGISPGDELVLRRVLTAQGRSRAYLNGHLLPVTQIARVAAQLMDITSQHAHHALADVRTHLEVLDAWAGLRAERDTLRGLWGTLQQVGGALHALRHALADRADRMAFLRFQIGEIDSVRPEIGEEDALEREALRLSAAVFLSKGSSELETGLVADGQRLSRAKSRLKELSARDPALDELLALLDGAIVEVQEVASELGRYASRTRADPEKLARIEARQGDLAALSKRFAATVDQVIERQAAMRKELATLDQADDQIHTLEGEHAAVLARVEGAAAALSAQRKSNAEALSQAISDELGDLGMGGASVRVEVEPADGGGTYPFQGAQLSERGMDRVEFLISTNRGEPPRPLREVASGGELSRALLALKRAIAGVDAVSTYVFDEVDTGTGGAVAEAIGKKLAAVGDHAQVICITHLPQIAAFGSTHLHISKTERDGRTTSRVTSLRDTQRTEELARMLSGAELHPAALEAAAAMLRLSQPPRPLNTQG